MWGALISAGIGVAGQFAARDAAQKQKLAGDDEQARILLDIEKGKYDPTYTIDPALADAVQQQVKGFDQMVDSSKDLVDQKLGAVVSGLRLGDDRFAGTLPQTMKSLADIQRETETQAILGKGQARMGLAQMAQSLRTKGEGEKFGLATQVGLGSLARAQGASDAGFVGEQQAIQNMFAVPLSAYTAYMSGNPRSTEGTGTAVTTGRDIPTGTPSFTPDPTINMDATLPSFGSSTTGLFGAMGMKVKKTPGEFNHNSNPLSLVDKNGGDTGIELTGGELVFNPSQSQSIQKFTKGKDSKGLLQYMRNLLNNPQFK